MKIRNSNLKVKKGKIQVEIFKIKVRNYNFKVRMWEKIFHNVSRMPFRKHLMIFIYYYIRKIVLYIYMYFYKRNRIFSATRVYTYKKCNLCMAQALFRNMSHVEEIERNSFCGRQYIYISNIKKEFLQK